LPPDDGTGKYSFTKKALTVSMTVGRYGGKCQFAHGKAELRSVARHPKYKTDLCRTFHTTGLCPYGPRCHFIHNDDERRAAESSELRANHHHQQLPSSLRHCALGDDRPRLSRQYSDYRPRGDGGLPAPAGHHPLGAGASELQRRASAVADAVIRRSISGYQNQLQTVVESDHLAHHPALNVNTAAMSSIGSATTDSFSSASSLTDSPTPSPTSGLLPPAVPEDPLPPAPPAPQVPQAPQTGAAWSPESAALLAELVSRLGPHDIAAALIRAVAQQQQQQRQAGNADAGNTAPPVLDLPRGGVDGQDLADGSMRQWDLWAQYQYQQQQQQRSPHATSNICW